MKKVYLLYPRKLGTIAPEIYGHFSEQIGGVFYDGLWVGKDSKVPNIRGFRKALVEKLKAINPPVLRWPGGCFAETYDWRDGIGENRPVRRGWWYSYDGRYENNEVGTHEFMDLCEMIGAKAYFAANLTSVTPLHLRDWVDYCLSDRGTTTLALEREKNGHPEPFDIPFWGVGNENWDGGGDMRPERYADEFRRYSIVMNNIHNGLEFFACGSNADNYDWTHGVVPGLINSQRHVNGFAMHYYCAPTGVPQEFDKEGWDDLLKKAQKMEEIIHRNWNIICGHNMQDYCKLVVDEWGAWYPDGSGPSKGKNLFEEQITLRDAMVAALTLNIFNRNCDKVRMANIAQLVNNIHALFLAAGEDFIVTPTYHVFDLYKEHQGAEAIDVMVTDNDTFEESISISASVKDGKTLVTIGNLSYENDVEISLEGCGLNLPSEGTVRMLADEDLRAHNTFEDPERVKVTEFTFNPNSTLTIPRGGIVSLQF